MGSFLAWGGPDSPGYCGGSPETHITGDPDRRSRWRCQIERGFWLRLTRNFGNRFPGYKPKKGLLWKNVESGDRVRGQSQEQVDTSNPSGYSNWPRHSGTYSRNCNLAHSTEAEVPRFSNGYSECVLLPGNCAFIRSAHS